MSSTSKPWLRDFICLASIWGASFLFMLLGAREFGAIPTAGLRVLVATLFLLPLLTLKGHLPGLRQHWKLTFFVGLLNSAIPFACFSFAFKIDAKPVVIDRIANEKQANGMAEFKRPTKNVNFQCWRKPGKCPLSVSSGSRNSVATSTRRPAVGMAPNSRAPNSVNRNDAPQIAARQTKSRSQDFDALALGRAEGFETEAVKTGWMVG